MLCLFQVNLFTSVAPVASEVAFVKEVKEKESHKVMEEAVAWQQEEPCEARMYRRLSVAVE